MTLLHMDGFDLGEDAISTLYTGASAFGTLTSTAFSYGRALVCMSNATLYKSITASSKVFVGCRMRTAASTCQLWFLGDSGATQHIVVDINSSGYINITRGGTSLGTYQTTPSTAWHYLEVAVTVSDTVGTVELRVDGATTPVINFSGDTKNGGTNTTIDAIGLRSGSSGDYAYWDDWYIANDQGSANNTFLGDVRVYTLAPTGAGNYTQFTPSTGANYACVDEQPYSTTDYVGSSTSGNRDSYALTDLPASVTTVFGVQELAVAAKSDAGLQSIKQMIRVNSTDYETSATVLNTSYISLSNLREQNPNTSAAWTPSGVNGTEIGVRVG